MISLCRGAKAAALLLLIVAAGCAQAATGRLSSYDEVLGSIRHARWVELTAYTLAPNSTLVRTLASKAQSGATVNVILAGEGFDYALQQNAQIAAALQAHGGHVRTTNYALHMKLLLTPTATIVTDTNFTTKGLYVRLNPTERAVALKAFDGSDGYVGGFTTTKGRSLDVEAALLAEGRSPIVLESESFGDNNPVYAALSAALDAHRTVDLIVNSNDAHDNAAEHAAIAALAGRGAHVVYSSESEKIAVNGDDCWTGSSNASPGLETQVDWGLRLDDASVCRTFLDRLRRRL
jgi:hypothetical protein